MTTKSLRLLLSVCLAVVNGFTTSVTRVRRQVVVASPSLPNASWKVDLLSSQSTDRSLCSELRVSIDASDVESLVEPEHEANTVVSATFGLMKSILGSGCLALPAGLAAISDQPRMLWPANLMMVSLGAISAYTFLLYGRLANQTGGKNLAEIYQKVMKTNQSTFVSVANFVYCFGGCLIYSLIIGDSLSSIMCAGGLSGWLATRQASILAVTGGILWPLSNLKSLAALGPVSILGVVGCVVATAFVALRCPRLMPSSPYAPRGAYLAQLPKAMRPTFGTYNRFASPAPLILVAMGCVAWMAHFSAPEFYFSLSGSRKGAPVDKSSVLRNYSIMTVAGYISVAVINAVMMCCGFLTFGGHCAGIILNNYATMDLGASLSRFLIAVSVIGGFPFLMGACRSSAIDLFVKKDGDTQLTKTKTTAILLSLITAIALIVKDAGFVVSFVGALTGTSIIYVFPSLLFLAQTASSQLSARLRLERWFCRGLIAFGAVSTVVGAAVSVMITYFPHLLV